MISGFTESKQVENLLPSYVRYGSLFRTKDWELHPFAPEPLRHQFIIILCSLILCTGVGNRALNAGNACRLALYTFSYEIARRSLLDYRLKC